MSSDTEEWLDGTAMTDKWLDARIKEAQTKVAEADKEDLRLDKDYPNQYYHRLLERYTKLKAFLDEGYRITSATSQGFVLNRKFIVAWQKKKWKVVGKGTWYTYRRTTDFKTRFN